VTGHRDYWVAPGTAAFGRFFPTTWGASTDHRPLGACATRFILPRASRPLQSTTAHDLLPRSTGVISRPAPTGDGSASHGVQPLIATSTGGVHGVRRHPEPTLRSVLGVSHALDGLLRHRPCGFVSPRCHVQGSPCRGLSLSAEPYRLSPAAALVPLDGTACGFDPAPAIPPPTSGPCSPPRVRCPTGAG
jgi:hypothetical protein